MNPFLEQTLLHLAGKSNIEQVSDEDLEQYTIDYPYFSVAQVLFAAKLKHQKDSRFTAQSQKSALYISNPWWLHYQLSEQEDVITETSKPASPVATVPEVKAEIPVAKVKPTIELPVEDNAPPVTQEVKIVPEQDKKKVVLTDGDDNINPLELLQKDTTLPEITETIQAEPTLVVKHENDKTIDEIEATEPSENLDPKPDELNEVEIDPRFAEETDYASALSDDNISPIVSVEHEAGIEAPEKTTEEKKLITTEFSIEEIEESEQLAQETLSDVEENSNEEIFVLPEPANEEVSTPETPTLLEDEMVEPILNSLEDNKIAEPQVFNVTNAEENLITTEFSKEELDQSGELAHEVLTEESSAAEVPIKEVPVMDNETIAENNQTGKPVIEEQPAEAELEGPSGLNETSEEANRNDQMLKNIQSILGSAYAKEKPAENAPLIPIDPYHTVDYFASQGIKLVLENEPADQLGKKLKKFTHWLRHMKKLGPEDALEAESELAAEATVIRIADFSNTQREVITEAMAEVLEKQGKVEKAVQIYIKLSFLEPDKSAYFAHKIKILKGLK